MLTSLDKKIIARQMSADSILVLRLVTKLAPTKFVQPVRRKCKYNEALPS